MEFISSVTGRRSPSPALLHLRSICGAWQRKERQSPVAPDAPRGLRGHLEHTKEGAWLGRHAPEPGGCTSGRAVPPLLREPFSTFSPLFCRVGAYRGLVIGITSPSLS